jgi:hypothetical protein
MLTSGCSSSNSSKPCPIGSVGCACTSGGACDPGLACYSSLCVSPTPAGGSITGKTGAGGVVSEGTLPPPDSAGAMVTGGAAGLGGASGSGAGGAASVGTVPLDSAVAVGTGGTAGLGGAGGTPIASQSCGPVPAACSAGNLPPAITTGPQTTACSQCVASCCCSEATTCMNNSACMGLTACLANNCPTADPSCSTDCNNKYPAGSNDQSNYFMCAFENCLSACTGVAPSDMPPLSCPPYCLTGGSGGNPGSGGSGGTTGSTGSTCPQATTGGGCMKAGDLYCGSVCCSSTFPYSCSTTGKCYTTEAGAAAACGSTPCSTCVVPTNTCTPSAGGTCADAGYLYCSGTVCCSSASPFYCAVTNKCYSTSTAAKAACGSTACSACSGT